MAGPQESRHGYKKSQDGGNANGHANGNGHNRRKSSYGGNNRQAGGNPWQNPGSHGRHGSISSQGSNPGGGGGHPRPHVPPPHVPLNGFNSTEVAGNLHRAWSTMFESVYDSAIPAHERPELHRPAPDAPGTSAWGKVNPASPWGMKKGAMSTGVDFLKEARTLSLAESETRP